MPTRLAGVMLLVTAHPVVSMAAIAHTGIMASHAARAGSLVMAARSAHTGLAHTGLAASSRPFAPAAFQGAAQVPLARPLPVYAAEEGRERQEQEPRSR